MNLKNIKSLQAERGFTIVELLIVIVVIGILVAIVAVAYTGITQQATNQKWEANAQSIRKVAETRQAQQGSYPTSVATFTSSYSSLPNGVSVSATAVSAAPSYATASANADNGVYQVNYCTGGVIIYYPQAPSSVTTINIGSTSSC